MEMATLEIRPKGPQDGDWLEALLSEHFGAASQFVHGTCFEPRNLAGFVATRAGQRVGALTYVRTDDALEIVTINSLHPGQGTGSLLLAALQDLARRVGCRRLWLITTNDNLNALRFYQKRGFVLSALHRDAVTKAREQKPEIPLLGEDGIPLRDELELEQALSGA